MIFLETGFSNNSGINVFDVWVSGVECKEVYELVDKGGVETLGLS